MSRALALYPGLPIVGVLPAFIRDRLALFGRVRAHCGDLGGFRLPGQTVALVSSAQGAREALLEKSEAFEKSPILRRLARPILGDGIVACKNASHRRQRRLLAPAFTPRQLASYADRMVESTRLHQLDWQDGARIELVDEMTRLTLRIVGQALFSVDFLAEARPLAQAVETAIRHIGSLVTQPLRAPLWVQTPANRRINAAVRFLDQTMLRMIHERRAGASPPNDLLTSLVQARDDETNTQLSDREVRDEVMNLFAAGHETTAVGLSWTFHLLMRHPAAAERLRAEAVGVLAGRAARHEDFERLPYALAVFKEAMRLYPPIHSISRSAAQDVEILGTHIPRGTIVTVSPLLMHHRGDYFSEPDAFQPERFLGAAEKSIDRYAYIPFGAGPRSCIGSQFSLLEATLVVATLAQQVRFEPVDSEPVPAEALFSLRPGLPVAAIVRRQPAPS